MNLTKNSRSYSDHDTLWSDLYLFLRDKPANDYWRPTPWLKISLHLLGVWQQPHCNSAKPHSLTHTWMHIHALSEHKLDDENTEPFSLRRSLESQEVTTEISDVTAQ